VNPLRRTFAFLAAALALAACDPKSDTKSSTTTTAPVWVAADLHSHTFLTDGSHDEAQVVYNAFERFGLGFFANSEHGGLSARTPTGAAWAAGGLGDTASASNGVIRTATQRWRWETIRDASFPLLFGAGGLQSLYSSQTLIQGVEWNVPSHEHASVGIVASTGVPVSDFEYQFDQSDKDRSRDSGFVTTLAASGTTPVTTPAPVGSDSLGNTLVKKNVTHADAVAGAAYLQAHFPDSSYVVINHPSRRQTYSAAHLRDLNEAAPDVVVGLEGFPGHQKEPARGGYGNGPFFDGGKSSTGTTDTTYRARTWGGADYMLAKRGGLMDSLWGEGRRFWVFVNADFHSSAMDADFWPGEYAKTWIHAAGTSPADVVKALKAGEIFVAQGDLVEALDFHVAAGNATAPMGGELVVPAGTAVTVTARFRVPAYNNYGDANSMDHLDLIAGDVTGKKDPLDAAAWAAETNPTTAVVKRFVAADYQAEGEVLEVRWTFTATKSQYLRLRGTNQPVGGAHVDAEGEPLMDEADTTTFSNTVDKAWADLWFYSNPVFVKVQ
jgi:hypothetical protein